MMEKKGFKKALQMVLCALLVVGLVNVKLVNAEDDADFTAEENIAEVVSADPVKTAEAEPTAVPTVLPEETAVPEETVIPEETVVIEETALPEGNAEEDAAETEPVEESVEPEKIDLVQPMAE